MRSTVAPPLPDGPRKMLSLRGEALGKSLSDADVQRQAGLDLARALELAGRSPQDVTHALGYANQSALSKLIGEFPLPLAKMLSLADVRAGYVLALAERSEHVTVETVVRVQRKRA